jgi:hypothetical protein
MSGSAKQFRAGRVVQIRLNPKDCMAIVDIIQQAKMFTPGMSFSQAVIIAFACMAETFRKNGLVPEREGFEYSEMMREFPDTVRGRGAIQYQIGKGMRLMGANYTFPAADLGTQADFNEPDPETHPNLEVRRLFRELKEMDARKAVDPLNFDQQLYDQLNSELCKLI